MTVAPEERDGATVHASSHAAGRRAIANTGLRAVGELAGKLASFVLFAVIARQLGTSATGTFVIAFAYCQVVAVLIDLGFDRLVMRRVALDLETMPALIADVIGLKLLLALPVTGASWLVAGLIGYPLDTRVAIYILSAGLLLDSLNKTINAVMASRERSGVLSVSVVVQRVTGAALGVGAVLLGSGVWAICVGYTAGSAIGLVTALVLMIRHIGVPVRSVRPLGWPRLLRESVPFALYDSLGFLLSKIDTVLLSLLATHAAAGLYGAASRLYESSFFITFSINGGFVAMFTYLTRTSVPTVGAMYERSIKLALLLLLPIAVIFAVKAEPLSVLFFGEGLRGAAAPLRALAPAVALMGVVNLSASAVAQRMGTGPLIWLTAAVLVINVVLNLALIPLLGAEGSAMAMSLALTVYAVGGLVLAAGAVGRPPLLRMTASPLLAGAVMALVLVAVGSLIGALIAGLAAFVATFALAERLIAPDELRYIATLLRGQLVGAEEARPGAPLPDRAVPRLARRLLAHSPLILCYHAVGPSRRAEDPEFLRVHPERFRRQLEALASAGARFTTVTEIARRLRSGASAAGLVAVSFDDGYVDNLELALPILRELGAPGTVFVATGLIGTQSPWMSERSDLRMMTEEELRAIAAAGFEVGAHTVSHADLTQLGRDDLRFELRESRERLEAILSRPVTSLAYPYFRYDDAARDAAEEAGFEVAVTGIGRGSFEDHLALPRVLIGGKDGMASFALKLTGHYDEWFARPTGRGLRVATRPVRRLFRRAIDAVPR